jgi:hypothetical protein
VGIAWAIWSFASFPDIFELMNQWDYFYQLASMQVEGWINKLESQGIDINENHCVCDCLITLLRDLIKAGKKGKRRSKKEAEKAAEDFDKCVEDCS